MRVVNDDEEDPRFQLPDRPTRWDWGMFLANALGTISNCFDELSEFFDACAGMLGGDFSARYQERELEQQNEKHMLLETLRDDLDEL